MQRTLSQPRQPEEEDGDRAFCYAVTDIEVDGPEPGQNSMLSFATVAVDRVGTVIDKFEGRLLTLEGATPDPDTLRWLQSQPEVWADATHDPKSPSLVLATYVEWLRALPLQPVFVASPLAFDGIWIDWYLRRFTSCRLVCGPFAGERLFLGSGIDLHSLIMGVTGWSFARCRLECYPPTWLGGHVHSHRAIDDALGYAHVLKTVLELRAASQTAMPAPAIAQ
jgi:hypothetical protein